MKVLTNKGYQSVDGIRKSIHDRYYEMTFSDGSRLECTVDHIFESLCGPITAKKLTKKTELQSKDGMVFLSLKKMIRRKFTAYDLVNVSEGSLYYTNNILSHNCSFLGSSNTLISATKIQQLVMHEPIVERDSLKIYEQPQPGKKYVATVDVAAGLGQDYSVVNIIDVTETPYVQVLVYRNNDVDPVSFSLVVEQLAKKYNMANLVIESNLDGKIVCQEVFDMEYENLIRTQAKEGSNYIKGGRRSMPGIMMTKSTKKIGCSKLKDLIETEVLVLKDSDTIKELSTFVSIKGSFGAENGKNDDTTMTLVMFAWFASTNYFTDITGNSTVTAVKNNRDDDDIYTLLGFVDDGTSDDDDRSMFSW